MVWGHTPQTAPSSYYSKSQVISAQADYSIIEQYIMQLKSLSQKYKETNNYLNLKFPIWPSDKCSGKYELLRQ